MAEWTQATPDSANTTTSTIASPALKVSGSLMGIATLDQFYTQPAIASECWDKVYPLLTQLAGKRAFFIEPSAGDGAFYELLPAKRRHGVDLAPRHTDIIEGDWLAGLLPPFCPPVASHRVVVIGNPPFGKRGKLAVEFMNRSFLIADTVAFIVPVIFRKYFIHKQITPAARLIYAYKLPAKAFRTDNNPAYSVWTEFQVWTINKKIGTDKRLTTSPPIRHADFDLYQYNNTREAEKVFSMPFDFAVPCQGYQDYTRQETHASACERHKQWMLFKARDRRIETRLRSIDFPALAVTNITVTPGFRKGDIVQKYGELYG